MRVMGAKQITWSAELPKRTSDGNIASRQKVLWWWLSPRGTLEKKQAGAAFGLFLV
jgi:hypothetical protein